jgi:hypothetical protein
MTESNYHPLWQTNRINFILNKYGIDFFKGKTILELAPFNGYIGHRFANLGATVHCVEGREDLVQTIKKEFTNISVQKGNLDTPEWSWGSWDIIINFGLYYHLEKYHTEHLINCLRNCKLMFFESVVFDSNESEIHFRKEVGADQSLSEIGGTPSTSYVENIFKEQNVKFTKYSPSELNGNGHHYDWVDKNSKVLDEWARRFWIVEK